ncbi:hypothetical protein TNCV_3853771 [Trichonephila clavipes]|nr:hypothetical protein TNCV_3853771 [Trichonephila clavipes]
MTSFGYWQCSTIVEVIRASKDPILGVIILLNCKTLPIIEKESLPVLIYGSSQKLSASLEPYEFVVFSEKLNFSQLVKLQSNIRFCYSRFTDLSLIPKSQAIYLMDRILGHLSGFYRHAFRWPYDPLKRLQCVFAISWTLFQAH